MPRESNVGACLTADLPAEPTPAPERLLEDHRPFADLAADTPLVRRLRALEPALGEDDRANLAAMPATASLN